MQDNAVDQDSLWLIV